MLCFVSLGNSFFIPCFAIWNREFHHICIGDVLQYIYSVLVFNFVTVAYKIGLNYILFVVHILGSPLGEPVKTMSTKEFWPNYLTRIFFAHFFAKTLTLLKRKRN